MTFTRRAVDGHVKVYSGRKGRLPKHFVSREMLCLPASTSYWIKPLLCLHKTLDPKMVAAIETDVVPALQNLGIVNPAADLTAEAPGHPALTLVLVGPKNRYHEGMRATSAIEPPSKSPDPEPGPGARALPRSESARTLPFTPILGPTRQAPRGVDAGRQNSRSPSRQMVNNAGCPNDRVHNCSMCQYRGGNPPASRQGKSSYRRRVDHDGLTKSRQRATRSAAKTDAEPEAAQILPQCRYKDRIGLREGL